MFVNLRLYMTLFDNAKHVTVTYDTPMLLLGDRTKVCNCFCVSSHVT